MNKTGKIRSIHLFRNLTTAQLEDLESLTRLKSYSRRQLIFSEGDPGDGFYMIVSGKVKIYKISSDGKEQILHIFSDGDPLGEAMAFLGKPYPAFAEAISATEVLYIPRNSFLRLIQKDPEIALNMMAILSRRLQRFTQLIDDLSLKEVPARLARYILHHLDATGSRDRLDLEISKQHLAAVIGTIPETLSRAFRKMTDAGILKISGSGIHVIDRNRLEEVSWSGKI